MTLKNIAAIVSITVGLATVINLLFYQFWYLPKIQRSIERFKSELKSEEFLKQERWKIKRDACIKALDIADALISNYQFKNISDADMKKSYVSTEDVRKCINDLATSCEGPEVLDQLKVILFDSITPAAIVELRNAVRKELEFGETEIDTDRDKAYVGIIITDRTDVKQ